LSIRRSCVGFATAFGVAVASTGIRLGKVWVVGVWDAVTVGIGVFTVVRIVRERVNVVGLAVTIGVGVVRVCTRCILLGVGQAIAVGVCISIATVGGVKSVGDFPTIR
jgi:hypothetical protein